MIAVLGLITILILANGLFAMVEAAVDGSRRSRLQEWADAGRFGARSALALYDAPREPLLSLRIGVTLASWIALLLGGAILAMRSQGFSEPARLGWLAGVGLLATTIVMIFGDLAPRRLGSAFPEWVLAIASSPIRMWGRGVWFLVWLLQTIADLVLKPFRVRADSGPQVTAEQIEGMIELGGKSGAFDPAEKVLMTQALKFSDRLVTLIMSPRTSIIWLDVEDTPQQISEKIMSSPHSRFPVCEGTLDNVVGVVHIKSLLAQSLRGESLNLRGLVQLPVLIPHTLRAIQVVEFFKKPGNHMAIVLDEFGGVYGLVTLTDVLEAIVGALPSNDEGDEPTAVQREDGSWLLDAMMSLEDFKARFDLSELPDEDRGDYQTLAGFLISQMNHIPGIGETMQWNGLRFEVVDTDGRRVDRILVSRLPAE